MAHSDDNRSSSNTSDGMSSDGQEKIHSEEVSEMLGYIPNWIVRWGITVIVAIVVMFLIGSWFVRYPDVISASIDITTENPPVFLKARSSGKLKHLLVADKETVRRGQYLAVLETTADFREVMRVKAELAALRDSFTTALDERTIGLRAGPKHLLGELQQEYGAFLVDLQEYQQFLELGYHRSKLGALEEELRHKNRYRDQLTVQARILQDDFALRKQQYGRTKELYDDGMVSQSDFEESRGALLQKEYNMEGARLAITNTDLQIVQLGQELLALKQDSIKTDARLKTDLRLACDKLLSQILAWEQVYVLTSPADGIVSLTQYWKENQNVTSGDNVLAVLPDTSMDIIGRIELPLQGAGKVRVGQTVNVKLAAFPYMEYGSVKGIIRSISSIPEAERYALIVDFPQGLVTNYGIRLEFSQKMLGTGEIITEDLRLLERIFNRGRSQIANGFG